MSPAFLTVASLVRVSDLRAVSPPAWSPQGDWLALSTQDAVWLVRPDANRDRTEPHERRVAALAGVTQVAWASGGQSLTALAAGSLYRLSLDGTPPVRLETARPVRRFASAPVGDRIAYAAPGAGRDDVWVVRGDGGAGAKADLSLDLVPRGEEVRALSWSPDGRGVLIALGPRGEPRADRFIQIDAARLRARGRSLAFREAAVSPALSPSGRFLAYLGEPEADLRAGRGQVVVVRADGTGRRALTSPGAYSGLAWSGVGDLLAFAASADEDLMIVVADPVTGERLQAADYRPEAVAHGTGAAVAWSPDGLRIAFGLDTGDAVGPVWIATLRRR